MADEEETLSTESGGMEALFSPEGIIMLLLAAAFDIGEFFVELLPGIGQVASIVIDLAALLFIGGWIYFRKGTVSTPAKTAKWTKRMKWIRPLFFAGEMIPIVGSLPGWLTLVYFELKHG